MCSSMTRRIRRSMAALVIASAVILILACVLGVTDADGADLAIGLSLSALGGVLGVGAGILTLRDAPVGEEMPDNAEAPAAIS